MKENECFEKGKKCECFERMMIDCERKWMNVENDEMEEWRNMNVKIVMW